VEKGRLDGSQSLARALHPPLLFPQQNVEGAGSLAKPGLVAPEHLD